MYPFTIISRQFASTSKISFPRRLKIPYKYRQFAMEQAQNALTDYLHNTRALPFTYADYISKNALQSLLHLISRVKFSAPTFSKAFQRLLRYHPVNEFEFFYESIGIDYHDINEYLMPGVFFFSQDSTLLNAAFVLSGSGFPWNKLGQLYKEEPCIFNRKAEFLIDRLNSLKQIGFDNLPGICLAFPFVLSEDGELGDQTLALLHDLKRVFVDFDLGGSIESDLDAWYGVCRRIRIFYDLGLEKGKFGELMGRSKVIFLQYEEQLLIKKIDFFCRLGVKKEDVALLFLKRQEILSFDLENPVISVVGFLKHFHLPEETLKLIAEKHSYVLGRNKLANLPHILRAVDLHEWFFDVIKHGDHRLLASYSLSSLDESIDETYKASLEKIKHAKKPFHTIRKLNFLHGVGFGENSFTIMILANVHGNGDALQERFDCLLDAGIEFAKLCKMLSLSPKIMNQDADNIRRKLSYLREGMGLSLQYLEAFPAYLCYDLENRIKPRYEFHMWLEQKGLCRKSYSIPSIIATSKKNFLARLAGIHPAAVRLWLERSAHPNHGSSCPDSSLS